MKAWLGRQAPDRTPYTPETAAPRAAPTIERQAKFDLRGRKRGARKSVLLSNISWTGIEFCIKPYPCDTAGAVGRSAIVRPASDDSLVICFTFQST